MIMSVIQSVIVRVARYVVFPHTNLLDNTIIHNYFRTLEGGETIQGNCFLKHNPICSRISILTNAILDFFTVA